MEKAHRAIALRRPESGDHNFSSSAGAARAPCVLAFWSCSRGCRDDEIQIKNSDSRLVPQLTVSSLGHPVSIIRAVFVSVHRLFRWQSEKTFS